MIYPKRIDWNGSCSGHSELRTRIGRSQRELVAASLVSVQGNRVRWDELTRTEYRTRSH